MFQSFKFWQLNSGSMCEQEYVGSAQMRPDQKHPGLRYVSVESLAAMACALGVVNGEHVLCVCGSRAYLVIAENNTRKAR